MKKSDFTYYMHDGPAAFSFELAGTISPDDAVELEQAWRTASSTIGDRVLVVDLSFVTRIDEAGRDLLRRWHEHGARLVANSPTARLLAESIIGAPLPAAASAPAPTYAPFFTQLTRRSTTFLIAILLTLLHPATALARGGGLVQ
jgi:ABC-type transporter Mla MlaB component